MTLAAARQPGSEVAAGPILQVRIRLLRISPMIWRRVLVPASYTLEELHGVIQAAMGWEGIHLFQFQIRAVAYGSFDVSDAPIPRGFRLLVLVGSDFAVLAPPSHAAAIRSGVFWASCHAQGVSSASRRLGQLSTSLPSTSVR
jgi:hypothetical protein